MKLKHTFLSAIFAGSMFLSQPIIANTFIPNPFEAEQAVADYKAGNYTQAFKAFKTFAEQGDAIAQFNLGLMYMEGLGTAKNNKQAFYWYQKAAAQGHTDAQHNLGYMYSNGYGTAKNKQKALYWYQKACQAGGQPACDYLKVFQ